MRIIVGGAPCSGKSTYVREHLRAGDLVYDYDTLQMALSGQASHEHDAAIRAYVLAARDAIFAELEAHMAQSAWVITSTRRSEELAALRDRLGAEVVLLPVDREEAHRRCDADGRPAAWHGYIDNWFDESDIDAAEWPMPEIKRRSRMKTKMFRAPMEFKAEGKPGEFTATFATLNVIDHDGDVTVPGAFKDGQAIPIAYWGHRWGDLPVGRGVVHADEEKAWVNGRFFLDTIGGLDTYRTVKNLEELQQWSYGFDIEESSMGQFEGQDVRFLEGLETHEVSPVLLGAGIGTQTTSIKGAKGEGPGAGDDAGDGDDGQSDAGTDAGDVAPSGPMPSVVMADIDIQVLEG